MPQCKECKSFFLVPENEWDYEKGAGDCVRELSDNKGKYWHARKTKEEMDALKCTDFKKR